MRKYKINLSSALANAWPAIYILHSFFADNIKESWKKHFAYITETLFLPFNSLCILPLCPVMHCFWRWAVTDIPSGFCRGKIGVS